MIKIYEEVNDGLDYKKFKNDDDSYLDVIHPRVLIDVTSPNLEMLEKISNATSLPLQSLQLSLDTEMISSAEYIYQEQKTENNENIAVAVGVGAASGQGGNVKAAVGGSFNVNTIDNSVTASMENVTLTGKNTDVNVTANNYSKSYKGAGGVAYAGGKGGSTNVGAGIAGNIDIYDKFINN